MNLENLEDIKVLMDNFDPAALLPDLTSVVGKVEFVTRIAVLVGPIVLLVLGLMYFFMAPKEANHHFGYRCYHGMGSVEAWRFTQRLAGIVWGVLGLGMTAVMLLLTSGYGGKEIMDIIGSGCTSLVWEVVLVVLSCIGINVIVMIRFDSKGDYRKQEI